MKKKKIIAIAIAVVAVIALALCGFAYYNHVQEQKYFEQQNAILEDQKQAYDEKWESDFAFAGEGKEGEENYKPARTHDEKIACIQWFMDESDRLESEGVKNLDSKYIPELVNWVGDKVESGCDEIVAYYDQTVKDNTLDKLEENNDKDAINKASSNLTALLEQIKNEQGVICDENQVKAYNDSITKLTESYAARVKSIEEAEKKAAEEKAAAEAAAAEQAAQKAANSGYSGGSGSSGGSYSGGGSSGGSYSGGSNGSSSGGSTSWYEDENGRVDYWDNPDGSWTAQDDKGNSWSSDDLKEWLD